MANEEIFETTVNEVIEDSPVEVISEDMIPMETSVENEDDNNVKYYDGKDVAIAGAGVAIGGILVWKLIVEPVGKRIAESKLGKSVRSSATSFISGLKGKKTKDQPAEAEANVETQT